MVNAVPLKKAQNCHNKALLTNIRYMQEKVHAMKATNGEEETKVRSQAGQEMDSKLERN